MPQHRWKPGHGPPTKFKPGQSGNPAGRPPLITDIHAMARQHAPAAIDALVKALNDPDRAIAAAIALLDRGYGRPAQAVFAQVNGSVLVGGIDAPPRETLEQWLARRRRELTVLDSQAEHAPSPPKGELAASDATAAPQSATVAERHEPTLSKQEARWPHEYRRG
jgi:hypothetical protein